MFERKYVIFTINSFFRNKTINIMCSPTRLINDELTLTLAIDLHWHLGCLDRWLVINERSKAIATWNLYPMQIILIFHNLVWNRRCLDIDFAHNLVWNRWCFNIYCVPGVIHTFMVCCVLLVLLLGNHHVTIFLRFISYLGMKSWDVQVCDRASTITHVDREKKNSANWNSKIFFLKIR